MSTFDNQDVYNKHQTECDCDNKESCGCKSDDCGCCPPGLVGYYDAQGNFMGCLTPTDAACLEVEGVVPPQGYQKVYSTGDSSGTFIGIMSNADAIAYYQAFGLIEAPIASGQFNPTTTSAIALTHPQQGQFDSIPVDFIVDRITCDQVITLTFSGTKPAGLTFDSGASSIVIPAGESILTDAIQIDDTVAPAVYEVEVVYTGCGNANTRTITVTVS
jgi:hypothetical protein